ncbi:hypothetical protein [Paenibacillus sp. NPDC057934]|uniref:hypothetical protein n=1 Tax=Paenibacillus sp. NPDC057934 TaxID=3346282 RepID=UPI0036DDD970
MKNEASIPLCSDPEASFFKNMETTPAHPVKSLLAQSRSHGLLHQTLQPVQLGETMLISIIVCLIS